MRVRALIGYVYRLQLLSNISKKKKCKIPINEHVMDGLPQNSY